MCVVFFIFFPPPKTKRKKGGGGGGAKTTGKICLIEVTENSLLCCSQVTWCSTRAHTLTSYPLLWYSRKIHMDKGFLSPLIKHCQNSKSGQYHLTSGSKLTGWNAPSHKRKLLCWPADIHSVIWSLHPPSSYHLPATRIAKRRAQGRNL